MQQPDEEDTGGGGTTGGPPAVPRRTGPQGQATIDVQDVLIVFQRHAGPNGPGIDGLQYTVRVGTAPARSARTGADGQIKITLAAGAQATLTIMGTEYTISRAASLEPETDDAGVRKRLRMLGYHVISRMPEELEIAILNFQADNFTGQDASRRIDGVLTPQTRTKLKEVVGE